MLPGVFPPSPRKARLGREDAGRPALGIRGSPGRSAESGTARPALVKTRYSGVIGHVAGWPTMARVALLAGSGADGVRSSWTCFARIARTLEAKRYGPPISRGSSTAARRALTVFSGAAASRTTTACYGGAALWVNARRTGSRCSVAPASELPGGIQRSHARDETIAGCPLLSRCQAASGCSDLPKATARRLLVGHPNPWRPCGGFRTRSYRIARRSVAK